MEKELLGALICPKCQGELSGRRLPDYVICEKDQLAYPIEEGIPVMLTDSAIPVSELPE